MAAAYIQADGGQKSPEMILLGMIDRFGVMAVLGRPVLYAREVIAMQTAETIVLAHADRQKSANWAAWQTEHPQLADLLFEAQKLADG